MPFGGGQERTVIAKTKLNMKIRVKFSRKDRVKYLGHLDIMRSFQRGFIRAGVKMIYSEGFSPHQKMNFAQPLGVGVTSRGDYLDAEVADGQDPEMIRRSLNEQMGEGFDVTSVSIINDGAAKGMAAVKYASYEVEVMEGDVPSVRPFMDAGSVVTVKKTKSGESETDIRPLVLKMDAGGKIFRFTVKGGSENNLKPDLLMQEIYKLDGMEYDRNNIHIERTELMAEGFVPLEDYQTGR